MKAISSIASRRGCWASTENLGQCGEPDRRSTARQIVCYGLALIPMSLVPSLLGMSGHIYLAGALVLGLWFLYFGVRVALERTMRRARSVLVASVLYLPLIYGLMLIDRLGL